MHPPRGLPHPAGMQGPIDDVALDVRRWPSLRIRQEKRAAVIRACPAPIPLLAVPCRAMSHPRRAVTGRTVEDFDHHDATLLEHLHRNILEPLPGTSQLFVPLLLTGEGGQSKIGNVSDLCSVPITGVSCTRSRNATLMPRQ